MEFTPDQQAALAGALLQASGPGRVAAVAVLELVSELHAAGLLSNDARDRIAATMWTELRKAEAAAGGPSPWTTTLRGILDRWADPG